MWTTLAIFFIVLFTYIHLQHQLKTGEDLDIYEFEYTSLKSLQEITQYKQPVLFALDLPSVKRNPAIDPLSIKDIRDYYRPECGSSIDSISLSQHSARGLLDTDAKSYFYSDRNQNSLAKSEAWTKWFDTADTFLQPAFTVYKECDVLYGSQKTHTIATYHRESHVYLYIPHETNVGPVRVKMTPWKSETFMDPVADYLYYEFWSNSNLYDNKNDRIKCLDFLVKPGDVLFIPPFWFYSIEYQDKTNEICMVKYTTGANLLANSKHIGKYFLQQQNIQEKWWKPLSQVVVVGVEDSVNSDPPILALDVSLNEVIIIAEPIKTSAEKLVSELAPKK